VYKGNDLSILSTETLINYYFLNDKRGISGKKVIIIGAGNIGFKLALKFVENGALTYLIRRNKKYLSNIVKTINIIKPKGTEASAFVLKKMPSDLSSFDIIIGSSDQKNLIKKNHVNKINNKKLFIDLGKGTFSKDCIKYLLNRKNNIFRLDTTSSYFSYLDNIIYTESIYKKDIYLNKVNNYNFVSQGILGQKNDIIVNDAKNPKKILGICDGNGNLKKLNSSNKNILVKKVKKDTGLKLIYE
jgi:heterodisulfide reductase subunit A-like polyferredoxin